MRTVQQFGKATIVAAGLVGAFVVAVSGAGVLIVGVPTANPSNPPASFVQPNVIASNYSLKLLAQGSDPLENPSGVISTLGNLNDASKTRTEPDENTYLVFDHDPGGPTPNYDYGRHFLFQGHENAGNLAYVTRINLDVNDPAHRITLLTPLDPATHLTSLNSVDGSTWNPFTRSLLFTQEVGGTGGVVEITADWPPQLRHLDGIFGKGGFEGVQLDDQGNITLAEDVGGTSVNVIKGDTTSPKVARQPNSFIYRFEPYNKSDLSLGGRLFALQVAINGAPVVFHAADPVGDTFADNQVQLHTPGTSWPVGWVLLHDTVADGVAPFDANALAKSKLATPFKRPENLKFLPGSHFDTFFFCPTGDTDAQAGNQPALARRGSWGSIFRVNFPSGSATGTISIAVLGDADHASFDNLTFASAATILTTEDRGDGLHDQLNKLDSVWAFDVAGPSRNPRRLLALGRDAAATAEDNEPTGIFVSDGATSISGLLGASDPSRSGEPRFGGTPARWFVTEQHGLNQIFEILPVQASPTN